MVRQQATGTFADLQLRRVGIWGYKAEDARLADDDGFNEEGHWEPQYKAVPRAARLVTGALGVNDMHLSDVQHWGTECTRFSLSPSANIPFTSFDAENCRRHAQKHVGDLQEELDRMFLRLADAQANGAKAVVVLLHNPYADREPCQYIHDLSEIIVGELNQQLKARAAAQQVPVEVADAHGAFVGHGAGVDGDNEFVFGHECEDGEAFVRGVHTFGPDGEEVEQKLQKDYDPHPNAKGNEAIAAKILALLNP